MAIVDTLGGLVRGLADALVDVTAAITSEDGFQESMVALGWDVASRPGPVAGLGAAADELIQARRALFGNGDPSLLELDRLRSAVTALVDGLDDLAGATFPPELAGTSFAAEVGRRLVEHALLDHLWREERIAFHALRVLGIVRVRYVGPGPDRASHISREILWDNIPRLLHQPGEAYREAYGWGTAELDGEGLLEAVQDLLCSLRWPAALEPLPKELIDALAMRANAAAAPDIGVNLRLLEEAHPGLESTAGLRFLALPATPGHLPALAILPFVSGSLDRRFPIDEHLDVELDADVDLQGGVGLRLSPEQGLELVLGLADPANAAVGAGKIVAAIDVHDPTKSEKTLLATAGGTRFLVTTTVGRAGAVVDTLGRQELYLEVELKDARIELASGEHDGFVSSTLPNKSQASFSMALVLSTMRGLSLRGSGSLQVQIPVSVRIGPVEVRAIGVAIEPIDHGVTLRLDSEIGVAIGPVAATIVGLGLEATLKRPTAPGSGPIDVTLSPAAPRGVGLVIDAGAVRGGGFLTREGERYTGALALDAYGVALSAYGVLDTAGAGYSLAAVVSAEFSPIQLGLGFTLDGVGGLIGIHRRIDTDALRAALRGPGIGDIFFAADPIAHAGRLTADLARYFPAAPGRYVFGPAVKVGWGTPTIVEGVLAILLEVPSPVRLVVLGSVSAALPTKDAPIILLNVDVVGEVDFARKTAAIDASLRDSKVAGFAITGDLALRMGWGDPPSFALAIGGFHSQFRPPPGFPELRRVRIPIGAGDNPRLDIQGFLALTSNTAQVGAQIDLYAAAGPLNVIGNLGFEALIQFVPFSFQVDLWAGVALRRGTRVLAGVHLEGTLRGPSPWHFAGEACLSLWFIDLCVSFDATFGQARPVELPERVIWDQLKPALEDVRSWSTAMSAATARAVTTAAPPGDAAATRIDPAAALTVRQKVVPLNRTIERFAQVAPSGANRFQVVSAKLGNRELTLPELTFVDDWFAAAQFEAMTDAERLSRPGYEKMVAGVTLAGDEVTTGPELTKTLDYETFQFPDPQPLPTFYRPDRDMQLAGTATGANAAAPLRAGTGRAFALPRGTPPLMILEEETFVIATTNDLVPRFDLAPAAGRGATELALKAYLATHPAARGTVQVVPRFEIGELL